MAAREKVGMPLSEFLEQSSEQPFELINGERIVKMPNVARHSEVIRALFLALYLYVVSKLLGEVYVETTFVLPDMDESNWVSGSRIPDIMFYAGKRMSDYKANKPDWGDKPFAIVPDFVIEVVSPTDKFSDLDAKIDAYLADGVRLIWVVDPQRRKAIVYAPDAEQPVHLAGDAVLDGKDVVPGFQAVLSKLFE